MISVLRLTSICAVVLSIIFETTSLTASNDFCVGDFISEIGRCSDNQHLARRICERARDGFEQNSELARCTVFVESSCERWTSRGGAIQRCKFAADRTFLRCARASQRRLKACTLSEAREEGGDGRPGPRLGGGRG